MPTIKQRISLSVSEDMGRALEKLAERDQTSVSSKTLELVRFALDLQEDAALLGIVNRREKMKVKYISHENTWT